MISHFRHIWTSLAALLALAFGLVSCDSAIYDDLDPCPQGVVLRFVYDYNMEFANGFPAQVHCLTVLIYDADGHYLETRTVTDRALLGDESWRMTLDLDPGKYTIVAYGGMACQDASFRFAADPATTPLASLQTLLKPQLITSPVGTQLHHMFYGRLDVTVEATDTERREATVEMMKDTNNLRILLQHVDGTPVNDADFTYTLTADNTLMGWDNALIPAGMTTYMPWTRGQASSGLLPDGTESILAFAEFSTGRFVNGRGNVTLTISAAADGREILRIPLINYLLLLKSQEFDKMGSQEFLDRESRWNMIFFLDNRGPAGDLVWLKTSIIINDWVVRINNFDL